MGNGRERISMSPLPEHVCSIALRIKITSSFQYTEHKNIRMYRRQSPSVITNMVDVDAVIIWLGTSQIRSVQNMADVAEST